MLSKILNLLNLNKKSTPVTEQAPTAVVVKVSNLKVGDKFKYKPRYESKECVLTVTGKVHISRPKRHYAPQAEVHVKVSKEKSDYSYQASIKVNPNIQVELV